VKCLSNTRCLSRWASCTSASTWWWPTSRTSFRIDLETAGLVAFSVQPSERAAYQRLFAERQVRKVYEAIAPVRPELNFPLRCHTRLEESPHFMAMHTVPGEPNADTLIELLRTFISQSGQLLGHYQLHPRTGRKHQLRAQMNHLGLPLLNDRIYPVLLPEPHASQAPDFSKPLQLLAWELKFHDPLTGQARQFRSQMQLMACKQPPLDGCA
jgi:tRNA pseudouridine32 synthase / 23S rRNA pseudouridine746 synthase